MKYQVKKPFLLRTNPNIPGKGEYLNREDVIDITVKRASAVRDLEGEGYLKRVTEELETDTKRQETEQEEVKE